MQPSLSELIAGPFRGLGIYGRARRLGVAALALALVTLAVALALGTVHALRLSASLDRAEQSSLMLMPRVTIEGGVARLEGRDGVVLSTPDRVVIFDTSEAFPEIEPAGEGDRRPRLVIRPRGLFVFTPQARAPQGLPWSTLNEAWPFISVDGHELVDSLRGTMPLAVAAATALMTLSFLLWQLGLAGAFAGLQRSLARRELRDESLGPVLPAILLCGEPAVVVGALALAAGGPGWGLAVHLIVFAVLALMVGRRLRAVGGAPTPEVPAGG